MTSLDQAVLARIESHGKKFEILVDPNTAYDYKKGKEIDLSQILVSKEVYRNAGRGERAAEEELIEAFGTDDVNQVAAKIIRKGELQLTSEQRKQFQEEKQKKIVALIAKDAVDPQTNLPHPPTRIENALNEAKVKIDPFKSAVDQLEDIVKQIRPVLPIKFARTKLDIKIPPLYTGRTYALVKRHTVLKEKWLQDGSLQVLVEISPSLQEKFIKDLNSATEGNVDTNIVTE